ncbi:hypothetical protein [Thermomonas sp.]|uniref:hypothetical protein n=1 Tax=Thermomonas sp. TaxID=1971895 RepID=UPI00391B74D4
MTTRKARGDMAMQVLGLAILAAAAFGAYWLVTHLFPTELGATADWLAGRWHAVVRWVAGLLA